MRNTLEAYQFNRYADPIVKGLSDVTFTLTLAALLALVLGKALDELGLDLNWREITRDMTPSQIEDWLETQNLVGAGIGGVIGLLLGGFYGAAFGAVAGSAAVEGGEAAYQALEDTSTVQRFITWWKTLDTPTWASSDGGLGSEGI